MSLLNLSDLRAGMTLASDVCDASGRRLLPAGSRIEDKHLRIFQAWGINEADIEGVDRGEVQAAAIAALDPVKVAAAEQHVGDLFLPANREDAAVAELYRLCVLRMVRRQPRERTLGD